MQNNQSLKSELDRAGMRSMQTVISIQLKIKLWVLGGLLIILMATAAHYFYYEHTASAATILVFGAVFAVILLGSLVATKMKLIISHRMEKIFSKREDAGRSNRPFTTAATLAAFAFLAVLLKPIWQSLWQEGFTGMRDKGWLPAAAILCLGVGFAIYTAVASTKRQSNDAKLSFESAHDEATFVAKHEAKITKKLLVLWALAVSAPVMGLLFIAAIS